MKTLKYDVLIACEFSGVVRDAFIAQGHKAISCDLLPSESPGPHLQRDVLALLSLPWKLIIAHPPCTRLCNSGVRWLHEYDLWLDMQDACRFFKAFLTIPTCPVVVENPIMHKYAKELINQDYSFAVQPWQHGEPYSKYTCFWVKGNIPALRATNIVPIDGRHSVHRMPRTPDRWKERSRTPKGIAKAMATQWGHLL